MTTDEVSEFMDLFADHFPDVGDWLRKQPGKTITIWQGAFQRLSFREAKATLSGFLSGEFDWPSAWGKWPAEISKRCHRTPVSTYRAPVYIDGEQAVLCQVCSDSGWVTCWHPVSVGAMCAKVRGKEGVRKFGDPMTVYTCGLRCYCDAGLRLSDRIPIFDESNWVRCRSLTNPESIALLEEFVTERFDIKNHPNYTDFGEYGGN